MAEENKEIIEKEEKVKKPSEKKETKTKPAKVQNEENTVDVLAIAKKVISGQFGTGDTLEKAIKDLGASVKDVMNKVKELS